MRWSCLEMYNPHQEQCRRCEHLKRDCNFLKFEEMQVVDVYQGVAKLVKCTSYKKRESR